MPDQWNENDVLLVAALVALGAMIAVFVSRKASETAAGDLDKMRAQLAICQRQVDSLEHRYLNLLNDLNTMNACVEELRERIGHLEITVKYRGRWDHGGST